MGFLASNWPVIRFAALSRSKRRRLIKKQEFRLKKEDKEDAPPLTVKSPSSSLHASIAAVWCVVACHNTSICSEGVVDSDIQWSPTSPVSMLVEDEAFTGKKRKLQSSDLETRRYNLRLWIR